MSGFFADKTYDGLDWMSQAVAPWDWKFDQSLRAFPEQTALTAEDLIDICKNQTSWRGGISMAEIVNRVARVNHITWDTSEYSCSWNTMFRLEGPTDGTLHVTDNKLEASEPFKLVKKKAGFSDQECREEASRRIRQVTWAINIEQGSDAWRRSTEILDLLGQDPGKLRSRSKRCYAIGDTMRDNILNQKWQIRNMELVVKISNWVADYINTGNVMCMANFAKFKVMTHDDKPIYSINEET